MDVIVAINNKLDADSYYRSDIFDLFGTPDGMKDGVIGARKGTSFQSLQWDWGHSGIIKICKFFYWNRHGSLRGFETWYNQIKSLNYKDLSSYIDKVLYVFSYKKNRVTAFIATVDHIEKRDSRFWFTFTPLKFVLLPPEFIVDYREKFFSSGRENPDKWRDYWKSLKGTKADLTDDFDGIFGSAAFQDQYHLIPVDYLDAWVEEKTQPHVVTKPIFVASICDNKLLKKKRLQTNNQIFWSILSQYIGRTQVQGSFTIIERGRSYHITDIPVNAFTESGYIYNQEVGTPYVVFQALKEVTGKIDSEMGQPNRLIEGEFGGRENNQLRLADSKFLKRAMRLGELAEHCERDYENTDYDYVLRLQPLGLKKSIAFDLTSGLWYKGLGKAKPEFVEQWLHNLFNIPLQNDNIVTVWHYGLDHYEEFKGKEIGRYLIDCSGLSREQYLYINQKAKISIPEDLRVVLIPFYDDNPDFYRLSTELLLLDPRHGTKYSKSVLYKICKQILEKYLAN